MADTDKGTSPYYSVHADHPAFYASSVFSSQSGSYKPHQENNNAPIKQTDLDKSIEKEFSGSGTSQGEGKLKFSQLPAKRKYTLIMLGVAYFGNGCGFSLPAPFFPREALKKGMSQTLIGLVFSVFQIVIVLASPFYGTFLSDIGPKFLFSTGIMTAGSTAVLFGFLDKCPSDTPFIVLSFLVRCVEALGVAASFTAGTAVVTHEFPDNMGAVFAFLETCIGIGMMVGPTIGGALYEAGGFGLPFWVVGGVIMLAGLMVLCFLPTPNNDSQGNKGSMLKLLRSLRIWVTLLCIMCGSSGIGYLDPTLSGHLDKFGLSSLVVGLFFVIVPGLHAMASPLWGWISDTKKVQSPLMILGALLCALSFLLIGPTPLLPFLPQELWMIGLGLATFGTSLGCCIVPTMASLVIGARELGFPDDITTFGLVSGLFQATFSLGAFVGPTIGGALVDHIGFEYSATVLSSFFLFTMLCLIAYFGTIRLIKRKKAKADSEETPLANSHNSSYH